MNLVKVSILARAGRGRLIRRKYAFQKKFESGHQTMKQFVNEGSQHTDRVQIMRASEPQIDEV